MFKKSKNHRFQNYNVANVYQNVTVMFIRPTYIRFAQSDI